ncbi:MAG: GNAT family N-acetyltransferase, partial [Candidatus Promineifilaceae bacterium]
MDRAITIRPYQQENLDSVVSMWSESKRAAFTYVEVQQLYTMENDRHYFSEVIAKDCDIWLAVDNDDIVGMMALRECLIDQLFVRLGSQRIGVGSALMKKAKELFPDGLRAY